VTNLWKATRVQRALTAIATLMVPVAFAGFVNTGIILLCIVCILVYAAAGLMNAKLDNDYALPKTYKIFMGVLLGLGLVISMFNFIVFLTYCAWIGIGFAYNTIGRRILYGDITLLAITHHALPAFSASLILGIDIGTALFLSGFMFLTFWCIIPLKNLKDADDDKQRGYATINTRFNHATAKTKLLFELAFLCIFAAYFVLDLSRVYLIVLLAVIVAKSAIGYLVDINEHENALNFTRLMAMLFLLGIVIDKTGFSLITYIVLAITASYSVFLFTSKPRKIGAVTP
jgi:hypothetical protein